MRGGNTEIYMKGYHAPLKEYQCAIVKYWNGIHIAHITCSVMAYTFIRKAIRAPRGR